MSGPGVGNTASVSHPNVHAARPVSGARDRSSVWARVAWAYIHWFSFYIDQFESSNSAAQASFHRTLAGLVDYMPCEMCRRHLAAHLAQTPLPEPRARDSNEFANARYCVDLHNAVNERQGKCIVPFEEVRAHFVEGAAQPACPASFSVAAGPAHAAASATTAKNAHAFDPSAATDPNSLRRTWARVRGAHPVVLIGAALMVLIVLAMLALQLWWMGRRGVA